MFQFEERVLLLKKVKSWSLRPNSNAAHVHARCASSPRTRFRWGVLYLDHFLWHLILLAVRIHSRPAFLNSCHVLETAIHLHASLEVCPGNVAFSQVLKLLRWAAGTSSPPFRAPCSESPQWIIVLVIDNPFAKTGHFYLFYGAHYVAQNYETCK